MKTIQLKANGMGRYSDVSPFPVGDMEIELIGIPSYSGEFRFVALCNGAKCTESTVSAAQNRVKIPRDKLTAGRFSCFVSHYSKGMEVKRFPVEDLLITELNASVSADPEIAQLSRRISALEQQGQSILKELIAEKNARQTAEKEAREATEYAQAIALGLVRFAFEDYRENVYLHGGSFEEFLQAYGIDLSKLPEEKIKEIKGENDNAEIE